MANTLINQGRFKLSAQPPCGTNGLGTCVGIAVFRTPWFIAHVDCATIVKSAKDPAGQLVQNYVASRLRAIFFGSTFHPSVYVFSGSPREFSARAIIAGVQQYYTGKDVQVVEMDGFIMLETGSYSRLGHDENSEAGDGEFSVPNLV